MPRIVRLRRRSFVQQSLPSWAQNINISISQCTSGTIGCYDFQVTNLPTHRDSLNFFWHFDDGDYSTEKTQTSHTFYNNLDQDSDQDVFLELTFLYDDTKPPARFNLRDTNGGDFNFSGNAFSLSVPTGQTQNISSPFHSREPKAGDSLTYVLEYTNVCSTQDIGGNLEIHYDKYKVLFFKI